MKDRSQQLSWSADFEFWFVVDKDGNAIGEADLLYDAELRLEHLANDAGQTLIIKPETINKNIDKNGLATPHRRMSLVGRVNGRELILESAAQDSLSPLVFTLRADPDITGGDLIIKKIDRKPFSPFFGVVRLQQAADGRYGAHFETSGEPLTVNWTVHQVNGKQREVKMTSEMESALKHLQQKYQRSFSSAR
jgi:hypothetical protein